MNLGGRIKQRRKELGWSQEELAQKSGIGQGTISKMERTDQETTTFLVELAEALGVSATWLRTGKADTAKNASNTIGEPSAHYNLNEKTLKRIEAIENAPAEVRAALDRMLGLED